MLKTIKGKVIAGVVTIGLVSGATVAFGATDAGAKLKAWYDVQFGQAAANVESDYTDYQKDKFEGFDKKYSELKEYATANINEVADSSTLKTSKNIDAQKKEHIDAIQKEKVHIESYMDSQFKQLTEEASTKINSAADETWKYANEGMLMHTDAKGAEARVNVKKELEATTTDAVNELKKAIDDAKNELNKELDLKSTATVKVLTDLIDTKINQLSKDITNRTNKLLALQYAFITTEAANLEKAAKQQMQDLVNGI